MGFTVIYIASAYSSFRGEVDYDISKEGPDRDSVLRELLTEIVDNDHQIPSSVFIETVKTVQLETEDGMETFKSEPRTVEEHHGHQGVAGLPEWVELKTARDNLKRQQANAAKAAAESAKAADRLRIYEEVKAEFAAKKEA